MKLYYNMVGLAMMERVACKRFSQVCEPHPNTGAFITSNHGQLRFPSPMLLISVPVRVPPEVAELGHLVALGVATGRCNLVMEKVNGGGKG